jgi:hypothetical protein
MKYLLEKPYMNLAQNTGKPGPKCRERPYSARATQRRQRRSGPPFPLSTTAKSGPNHRESSIHDQRWRAFLGVTKPSRDMHPQTLAPFFISFPSLRRLEPEKEREIGVRFGKVERSRLCRSRGCL